MNLQPHPEALYPHREKLRDVHHDYCRRISGFDHGITLETAAYIDWVCHNTHLRSVADLGSGFTSYVLRRYADEAALHVEVASVDSDVVWLNRTEKFLAEHGLSTDRLLIGETWLREAPSCDLIVHDYAGGAVREFWMGLAATGLESGGVLIFDDAHHAEHHRQMNKVCREHDLAMLDIFDLTVSEDGRFAAVAS